MYSDVMNIPNDIVNHFKNAEKVWHHHDLLCFIVDCGKLQGLSSYYCGYVVISPLHCLHAKDYQDLNMIEVHGGLTFGEFDDKGTVYGFDCNHWTDNIITCNLDYVTNECNLLADQLIGW